MKVEKTERGAYVTTETIDVSMTPEEAKRLQKMLMYVHDNMPPAWSGHDVDIMAELHDSLSRVLKTP